MGKNYYLVEVDEHDCSYCNSKTCEVSCVVIVWLLSAVGLVALLFPWYIFGKSMSLTTDDIVNGNFTLSDSFTKSNEGTTIEEELNIIRILSPIMSVLGTIVLILASISLCCYVKICSKFVFIANGCFIVFGIVIFVLLLFFNNKLEELTIYSKSVSTMRNLSMASAVLAFLLYIHLLEIYCDFCLCIDYLVKNKDYL